MQTSTSATQYVQVPKAEYAHLKAIDKEFCKLVKYMKEIQDTAEAREDIKAGQGKSLEQVARELGL